MVFLSSTSSVPCVELLSVVVDGCDVTMSSTFVPTSITLTISFDEFEDWDEFVDAFEQDGVESDRVDESLGKLGEIDGVRCTEYSRYDLPVPDGVAIVRRHVRRVMLWA